MVVTREDIRRSNYPPDKDMKGNVKSNASKPDADDQNAGTSNVSSNPRSRRRTRNDVVDLNRLNTAEFDKILGEGPDPSTNEVKKNIAQQRKLEATLRFKNIVAVNSNVVKECNAHDNLQQNSSDGEDSGDGQFDDKLDATLPIGHPQLDDCEAPDGTTKATQLNDKTAKSKEQPLISDNTTKSKEQPLISDSTKSKEEPLISDKTTKSKEQPLISDKTRKKDKEQSPNNDKGVAVECMDRAVQTENVLVGCSCPRCQAIFNAMMYVFKASESHECQFLKTSETQATSKDLSLSIGSVLNTSSKDNGCQPLYVGSTIIISSTDKAMLRDLTSDDDPKDFVSVIMESMYTSEQMANMSAMGRTPGSTKMDPLVFKQILAYLKHKFKGSETSIDRSTVVNLVNGKCYTARRQCWEKIRKSEAQNLENSATGSNAVSVRERLPKKTKDPNKSTKPTSQKGKRPSNEKLVSSDAKKKKGNKGDSERHERRSDETLINRKEKDKGRNTEKEGRKRSHEEESSDKRKKEKQNTDKRNSVNGDVKHKTSKAARQLFKSNASEHFSQRKSPRKSPKKNYGSPFKVNSKSQKQSKVPSGNYLSLEQAKGLNTSTPKFGGKRPKPFPELVKITYQNEKNQDTEDDDSSDLSDVSSVPEVEEEEEMDSQDSENLFEN